MPLDDSLDDETDLAVPPGSVVSVTGLVRAPADAPAEGAVDYSMPRYEVKELIGSGGEGSVYLAMDNNLQCPIAMKVLRADKSDNHGAMHRFVREARVTSSLQHSGVPAVHELAYSTTNQLYFTMRLVQGRTLRDVLQGLKLGDPQIEEDWSLVRLVQVLQRVALTVHYAHTKGLVHRDLKPSNIAVGDFGEVLTLDWGLSKRVGPDPDWDGVGENDSGDAEETQHGTVKGTPAYMAPEQAVGDIHLIDARTDVFTLGAILYEVLYLQHPYAGGTADEVLHCARTGTIREQTKPPPGRDPPRGLAQTALRALSVVRSERHQSAAEFADDLQAFLEGRKEQEWRVAEAHSLLAEARRLVEKSHELQARAELLRKEAEALRSDTPDWAPEATKEALWELEDRQRRMVLAADDAYAKAFDSTSRAVSHDEENAEARALMGRFYFERFLDAERRGNAVEAAWLRRKVARYNDGALDEALEDAGALLVATRPPGAQGLLARLVERKRRMVEDGVTDLGMTPTARTSLPMASYVLHVRKPGWAEARIPLVLHRGEQREIEVDLVRAERVPDGFVYVHGGPFPFGAEKRGATIPGFLIARRPVLLSEYARWLDTLLVTDPDRAVEHLPRTESHGRLLHVVDGRHVFCPASPAAPEPILERRDLPCVGISRESASTYAAWLGMDVGVPLRLPTELEWEKAARGADGRAYPWGDAFDPTFCSMATSTEERANLRPVGAFPSDVSPYGCMDMAGGVREWCKDDPAEDPGSGVCRGGAWYLRADDCRTTARWLVDAETRNPGIGFRLAADVPDDA